MAQSELRVNERISAPVIMLVDAEGKTLGEKTVPEALQLARAAGLDLVEVAPLVQPPVCRILDFGKFKYGRQRHKGGGGARHHVSKLKELRLRPNTDAHDVQIRVAQARKFLERGDRVLVTVVFKGRELSHMDLGRKLLADFAAALQDLAKVEKEPGLEGRRMGMMLIHHKS